MKKILLTGLILLIATTVYAGSFTINYPNGLGSNIVDFFARVDEYQSEVLDVDGETLIANPETKGQFVKRKLQEDLRKKYTRGKHLVEKDSRQADIRTKEVQAETDSENITVQ